MVKNVIKISPLATQKLKEIVNGSKKEVEEFFENVDKYIEEKKYDILMKGNKNDFYYKKCKNVYLVFVINPDYIGVIDFLTEIEFDKIKNSFG